MTSINFNAAATTALRTLQQTNSALETSQTRVSTGLKIGAAKDNAAYWSISTTLKSDNKALNTVKDALSLGAATVDTAYQGLNKSLEVLNEIKSKVTAASQDGVDKQALQSEIVELQKQLTAIATASTFSGENWLSVNSSVNTNATKDIVSSFSRDAANNVTLSTIKIDTSALVLIDGSSSKEGILDAGKSGNSTLTGGIALTTGASATPLAPAKTTQGAFSYTTTGGTPANNAKLDATITVDGTAFTLAVTTTAGLDSAQHLADSINAITGFAAKGVASVSSGVLVITSNTSGASSSVAVSGVNFTKDTGSTTDTFTGLANTNVVNGTDASVKIATMAAAFTTFTLDANDTIKFDVTVNGTARTVKIDKATVAEALKTPAGATGKVTTAADYALVLSTALNNANISGVTVTANTGGNMVFTGAADTKTLAIGAAKASNGASIMTIDITSADKAQLTAYLENISSAADKVTTGAALLGAVSSRIELQTSFVDTLTDTIDKGVSNLIDADLSEESTRLQALQTKQQLGIQALSIANSSTQNVLSLFRS